MAEEEAELQWPQREARNQKDHHGGREGPGEGRARPGIGQVGTGRVQSKC